MKEQTWDQWLRACSRDPNSPANVAKGELGMLTGTDARTLRAIAALWEVYAYTGELAVLDAVSKLLQPKLLQPKCWRFAKELIARSMDWSDRDRVWALLALPEVPPHG
jgi:hypothetical protein